MDYANIVMCHAFRFIRISGRLPTWTLLFGLKNTSFMYVWKWGGKKVLVFALFGLQRKKKWKEKYITYTFIYPHEYMRERERERERERD